MFDLDQLEALRAVAREGSLTRAADLLHLSPSAVSQRLARLEKEIGQPVLQPHGRTVRLTPAAQLLAQRADQILSLVHRAHAELEHHRGLVVGSLSVAAFPTAVRGLLPHAMRALTAHHPDLRLHIHEQEAEQSLPLLARSDLDVAIVQDWVNRPLPIPRDLGTEPLLEDTADLALPAGHPLAGRATVGIAEIADDSWISWGPGNLCHDWLLDTLRAHNHQPRIAHTAAEYSTQLTLVHAGLGIALIPRLGREPAPSGVRILPVTPAPTRRVYAAYRRDGERRPALRAVLAALRTVASRLQDEDRG
ncbi:DNA-binding transcriptional LysR family regulator [Streptosporangium becharense]|uniref:DNA-binding transcriptional LysR family regulator n=1 Tax=Streptosporangium becharense TaxID=1816182 RepID=A0A7W9IBN9_9ACTN|nr:LysR family transcriptional regulator [Streptosporangium becharense]MBB2910855.1 DNA-binding transcriptional LysR family regulator [Streptosporangium becharense]MBB5817550.1 DNA-binding transcriptional LysR family regulator [Streptosporangium becharense]